MYFFKYTRWRELPVDPPMWVYSIDKEKDLVDIHYLLGTKLIWHKPSRARLNKTSNTVTRENYTEETVPEDIWVKYCALKLKGEVT